MKIKSVFTIIRFQLRAVFKKRPQPGGRGLIILWTRWGDFFRCRRPNFLLQDLRFFEKYDVSSRTGGMRFEEVRKFCVQEGRKPIFLQFYRDIFYRQPLLAKSAVIGHNWKQKALRH